MCVVGRVVAEQDGQLWLPGGQREGAEGDPQQGPEPQADQEPTKQPLQPPGPRHGSSQP